MSTPASGSNFRVSPTSPSFSAANTEDWELYGIICDNIYRPNKDSLNEIIARIKKAPPESLCMESRGTTLLNRALSLPSIYADFGKDFREQSFDAIKILAEKLPLNAVSMKDLTLAASLQIRPDVIEAMARKVHPQVIKNDGHNALNAACSVSFPAFETLIRAFPREALLSQSDYTGDTPLHNLTEHLRLNNHYLRNEPPSEHPFNLLVQALHPEDFSITNKEKNTPLHIMISIYFNEKMQSDIFVRGSPLAEEEFRQQSENLNHFIMSLIGKASIDALATKNAKGKTPLFLTIQTKRSNIAKALIAKLSPKDLLSDPEAVNLARSQGMNDIATSMIEKTKLLLTETVSGATNLPKELAELVEKLR